MKIIITTIILILFVLNANSQPIVDFKIKNSINQKERLFMLDLIRVRIKKSVNQDCIFVVDHFKVSENYAYFEGQAQRRDGKPLDLHSDVLSCCLVTCLFKKVNNVWVVEDCGYFGSDCWFCGIGLNYPEAPKEIFPSESTYYE